MPSLSEGPGPLRILKKQPVVDGKVSLINIIRKLREEQQIPQLAEVKKSLTGNPEILSPDLDKFVLDMQLEDSDWAASLYALTSVPDGPVESPLRSRDLVLKRGSVLSPISTPGDGDLGDVDDLTNAMDDLHVVIGLPSMSSEHGFSQRDRGVSESSIPERFNTKQEDAVVEQHVRVIPEASRDDEASVYSQAPEGGEAPKTEALILDMKESLLGDEKASQYSVTSVTSDEFEHVGPAMGLESEHNGEKKKGKKWYRLQRQL